MNFEYISTIASMELLSGRNFVVKVPKSREKIFFAYYKVGIYKRAFITIQSSKKGSMLWRGERLSFIKLFGYGFYEKAILTILLITGFMGFIIFPKHKMIDYKGVRI